MCAPMHAPDPARSTAGGASVRCQGAAARMPCVQMRVRAHMRGAALRPRLEPPMQAVVWVIIVPAVASHAHLLCCCFADLR